MPQLTVFKENGALSLRASQQSPDIGGTISNIVFGVCACAIGGVTIWQGYKAWTIWRVHGALSSGSTESRMHAVDIEIASVSPSATSTSPPHDNQREHIESVDEEEHEANTGEGSGQAR